jgi:hypothetical protein
MITNDARCTREISAGMPWQKQRSARRRLFTRKMGLNFRKKVPVVMMLKLG